ncbi:hypothetical protein ACLGIH_06070 [Streptomyces sp. HMX87]|uniref:hypothetical protein n=1 Tax=Streptomyces sp. HMX87 TaxID=3390849 RepID=UPI003A8C5508
MNATARGKRGARMTIHVYRVDRDGKVTEDQGTVSVTDLKGPPPSNHIYPPCKCPLCRADKAAAR